MNHFIEGYSQSVRNFFQNQYDSIINAFDGNDFKLDIWATFIMSVTLYWSVGLSLLFLDLTKWPKFLYKYKIQDTESASIKQIIPVLKQVIINQTIVSILFAICAHFLGVMMGHKNSPQIPSIDRIVKDWIVFVLLREFGFYYSHRLLHHPSIYKYIHKKHHEWQTPIAITAIYCHPFEHVFGNLLPAFLGPAVMSSHRFTIWLWLIYITLLTLNDHSGYHFPLVFSPEFHDYHHLKFNQNYGIIGLLDWFHGTDQMFRKSKAFQRNRILTSLQPIKTLYPDINKNSNNNNNYKTK